MGASVRTRHKAHYIEMARRLPMSIPGKTNEHGLAWLGELVQMVPPGVLVDLGTYHGRSAMMIAVAAQDKGHRAHQVLTIDNYTEGPDAKTGAGPYPSIDEVRHLFRHLDYVHIVKGDTCTIPEIARGGVSLVFVDADHTAVGVLADIATWEPLVVPGGIMAFDDYDSPRWPEVAPSVDGLMWTRKLKRLGVKGSVAAFRKDGG